MRPKGSETPQEVQKGKELFKKNSKVEFFFFFFFFFFFSPHDYISTSLSTAYFFLYLESSSK